MRLQKLRYQQTQRMAHSHTNRETRTKIEIMEAKHSRDLVMHIHRRKEKIS